MKLLTIEWIKFKGNNFFWIGMGLYLGSMLLLLYYFGQMNLISSENKENRGMIDITNLADAGLYKLPYIWQNLLYLAIWFKFIPAFIFIFFVGNEFTFKTFRQNVIDGLSVWEFYLSKLLSAFTIALLSFFVTGLAILVFAWVYNPDAGYAEIFSHSDYLAAYFAEVFFLMVMILFLVILTRKSTITIIIFLIYYFILEPFAAFLINGISGMEIGVYLPSQPSRELITQPFGRLFNLDVVLGTVSPDSVNYKFLWLTLLYTIIFAAGGYFLLKRRDI